MRQNMAQGAHAHMCVPVCASHAAISAFAAASVAEPRVIEHWLCSPAFPSLIPPGSCLPLTPLLSLSLGSPFCLVLSSLLSLVHAAIHLPQGKKYIKPALFFFLCMCYLQFGFCQY